MVTVSDADHSQCYPCGYGPQGHSSMQKQIEFEPNYCPSQRERPTACQRRRVRQEREAERNLASWAAYMTLTRVSIFGVDESNAAATIKGRHFEAEITVLHVR